MNTYQLKQRNLVLPLLCSVVLFTGCQPKDTSQKSVEAKTTATEASATQVIPAIQAKVIPVKLAKPEACETEGCTQYDIQTVETNFKWIDQYFMDRIKKADPIAFSNQPNEKVRIEEGAQPGLNQSSTYVRYVGQNDNFATFAMQSYSYSAGAAHGMYHQEFVNFDLSKKKRLALQDVLMKGIDAQVLDALYDNNQNWLQEHNIEKAKLQLSDNFYYGANGLVFVYPLYELASYAEGMSELTLPYYTLKKFVRPEYLPSLPQYPEH
ncbi:MAG TPA: RsiV family protein [Acinetobacter sp.]|nr:RsiV family protein [Acinetobacter sp.]